MYMYTKEQLAEAGLDANLALMGKSSRQRDR